MLAVPVTELPRAAGWAFEFKWDGVRALLDVSEHGLVIHSRAGNEITAAYPELAALATGIGDVLLDGEIVAIRDGRPSFELLQSRMHVRGAADARRLAATAPVTYVVFDVLRSYGVDLTARPYEERRATLQRWVAERPGWTLSPAFDDGAATEAAAREHGLEGVVAKRLDSRYRPGVRSPDWVKLRFLRAADLVVVGWEAAGDRPDVLSSLVLARHTDDGLVFAGKAGSGLTTRTAAELQQALTPCDTCRLPAVPPASPGRAVHWVEPEVVVEVEFAAWTDDRRLRQPVFRRVRTDKGPDEATGES